MFESGRQQQRRDNRGSFSRVTCADDALRRELLGQRRRVGVTVGVELPAGDPQVEAQPGRVAVAAAVPPRVLVAFAARAQPAERKMGREVSVHPSSVYFSLS